LAQGNIPPICDHIPRYDDEILCLSFFRTVVEDAKMEDLTIPRTYFSRSQIERTSFRNSEMTESVANWNNFEDVDFSGANLTRFDFRACQIDRVKFVGADLTSADLRCCAFDGCDFKDANMNGTRLTRMVGEPLDLSPTQRTQVEWHDDDGEEPDGG